MREGQFCTYVKEIERGVNKGERDRGGPHRNSIDEVRLLLMNPLLEMGYILSEAKSKRGD